MYELVSVSFPFTNDAGKGKLRPGFIITPLFGRHNQVIVAYVTTQLDEVLETDILLNPFEPYFLSTGLKRRSLVKLHRLGTFQPEALKLGEGSLPDELIPELKQKLMKIFQLPE
ncbi:MAG: Plasmid maintenance toxin/cell growth inhibitor [Candidatus Woesebacteria bacterium GW2011_GWB1_38_5b]|uniref:Plasmid maintenance toxin/cell growth inhibitor n=1 Tax=Candidatus Woesebacteria bacterium GW2011_GWB1_38_5b TaxID=1618569 RepID=A0A0G0K6H5_9BACT|nr:MAG: Plasmid maintenance toxin/cell growth inhibitor [Candidatus Woesebacteria bacterium GW2011_GWB1_38_5b]